jgi:hypothetical protein
LCGRIGSSQGTGTLGTRQQAGTIKSQLLQSRSQTRRIKLGIGDA